MTTGYDCEDILNVVLARPIMSPTDFIQIKGRGTRLFTFKHQDGENERTVDKDGFALFDFFANCEYFEEDFDYDQKLIPPREPLHPDQTAEAVVAEFASIRSPTPRPTRSQTVEDEAIGSCGMRIDREMYRDRFAQQANEAVASDAVLRDAFDAEDWPAVEERVRRLLFEKPEEFWNLPKLQEVYKTDRSPSLREILAKIFGVIPSIPTRDQLADEAFERFVTTQDQTRFTAVNCAPYSSHSCSIQQVGSYSNWADFPIYAHATQIFTQLCRHSRPQNARRSCAT